MTLKTPNYEMDHIYAYVITNRGDGTASSPSHFCTKLHIWLELSGLPYTLIGVGRPDGPYGKVPYIELNGQVYGDSSAIVEMLSEKYNKDLDADLSPEQKAMSVAVQRMVEEHAYFLSVADIALQDGAFSVMVNKFLPLSAFTKLFVPSLVRRNLRGNLNAQGIGRLSEADRSDRMKKDIASLSGILGNKKYFMCDEKPTTVDATVFGYLWTAMSTDSELTKFSNCEKECRKYDNLMAYFERMQEMMMKSAEKWKTKA
ncbi:hypothetical protein FOZ60_003761 [Perkinsus olseni]|uniref:GST N-terminal domain-containing protein n=2 Tax=Perkinsus olseni TaxID=32597 RepID=A0A7J6NVK2_PEROL|nr:hypothetical protein FOZ60_003761 [Perkinsus olseni]